MATSGTRSSVLITGGSDGIGRGLAARYLAAGADVLVTGRNAAKLAAVEEALPGVRTLVNDIGRPEAREELAAHVARTMPGLNILVNNAGIQRRVSLAEDDAPWAERQREIDILLSGPVHLTHLLIPAMLAHGSGGLIANVTSGGAYVPQVFAPLYSACKAALHSYTVTLRHALARTGIGVVEIIPPAVRTGLAGGVTGHGADPDAFCDAVFEGLGNAEVTEIGFGPTADPAFVAARKPYDGLFAASARRFPVATYAR